MKKIIDFFKNVFSNSFKTLILIISLALIILIFFYQDNKAKMIEYSVLKFFNSEINFSEANEILNESELFLMDFRRLDFQTDFTLLYDSEGSIDYEELRQSDYYYSDYSGSTEVFYKTEFIFQGEWRYPYRFGQRMITRVLYGQVFDSEILFIDNYYDNHIFQIKGESLCTIEINNLWENASFQVISIAKTEIYGVLVIKARDFYRQRNPRRRIIFYDLNSGQTKILHERM